MAKLPEELTPEQVQRWSGIGLLSALAMALGYLETFIPIPIPGVKLGLANIAILIALARKDAAGAFCVGVIKVLAAGLLFGNPLTMAYSAAGTLLALAVMIPLSRIDSMHLAMVSVVGALFHEIGQLAVAMLVLGTPLVWYSAPVLLAAGCITGAICGVLASRTVTLLGSPDARAAQRTGGDVPAPTAAQPPFGYRAVSRVNVKAAIAVFLAYCIVVLHLASPMALAIALAVAIVSCLVARVRPSAFVAAVRPLALIAVITLVAQMASQQQGEVLLSLGPAVITSEAVAQAAAMLARLFAISTASLALMALCGTDDLVGAIRWMMRPLRKLGLQTEGFALALQTALQAVPLLARTLQEQMPSWKSQIARRELWTAIIPQFIADAFGEALRD